MAEIQHLPTACHSEGLAEILERVLDKGVVIAGDVTISLVGVELLNIRLRLLIASVDKAVEMGINWWQSDPTLSSQTRNATEQNRVLQERLDRLETLIARSPVEERQG